MADDGWTEEDATTFVYASLRKMLDDIVFDLDMVYGVKQERGFALVRAAWDDLTGDWDGEDGA